MRSHCISVIATLAVVVIASTAGVASAADGTPPVVRGFVVQPSQLGDNQQGVTWATLQVWDVSNGDGYTGNFATCLPLSPVPQYETRVMQVAADVNHGLLHAAVPNELREGNFTLKTYKATPTGLDMQGECQLVTQLNNGTRLSEVVFAVDGRTDTLYAWGNSGSGYGYSASMLRVRPCLGPGCAHRCPVDEVSTGVLPASSRFVANPSWVGDTLMYGVIAGGDASVAYVDVTDVVAPVARVIGDEDVTTHTSAGDDQMRWLWLDRADPTVLWGFGQVTAMSVQVDAGSAMPQPGHNYPHVASTVSQLYANLSAIASFQGSYAPVPQPAGVKPLVDGAWIAGMDVGTGADNIGVEYLNPVAGADVQTVPYGKMDVGKDCVRLNSWGFGAWGTTFVPIV